MSFLDHWRQDFFACLAFFTRLPVPSDFDHSAVEFSRATRAVPLAAIVPSGIAAIIMAFLHFGGAPSLLAAGFGLATVILLTGALHEDGLSDTFDGIGGGRDIEKKLAIMRDSRLGSYGAIAMVFSVLLRTAALAALLEETGIVLAGLVFVTAAAGSRLFALSAMMTSTPARLDGAAQHFSPPTPGAFAQGLCVVAILMAFCSLMGAIPIISLIIAGLVSAVSLTYALQLIHKQIGGYTGDTIGAGQQIAEIAFLSAVVMAV